MPQLPLSPIRTGGKTKPINDQTIEVDGLIFDVDRRDSRRTIQITAERTSALSVTAPAHTEQQMTEFIQEKCFGFIRRFKRKPGCSGALPLSSS